MKHKRIYSLILAAAIAVSSSPSYCSESVNEQYQEEITTMTQALKDLLEKDKQEMYDSIASDVRANGWDYDLTVGSFKESDVFKEVKYMNLIAAYMTCKNAYKDKMNEFTMLKDVPLMTYTYTEETIEEAIPEKVDSYTEVEEGIYEKKPTGVYIIRDTTIPVYKEQEDGTYIKVSEEEKVLEKRQVKYGSIVIKIMTPEELFSYYGVDAKNEYETRVDRLSHNTGNEQLYQSLYARAPLVKTDIDLSKYIDNYDEVPIRRKEIVEVAKSLKGQVPYQWGGKPEKAGYDTKWWTYDENNEQRGLDCSGFVQWVYMTASYDSSIYGKLYSTYSILESDIKEITEDELQAGDIGVYEGLKTNHTGIYLGKKNGKEMWIHCNSKDNNVSITEFNFQKFYSPLAKYDVIEPDEKKDIDNINGTVYSTDIETFTKDDIYVAAQLVTHEAGGEGLNGWVAVAEVLRNRINSPLFPNTVNGVVFQKGQFSYVQKIVDIVPSEEIIEVTKNTLEGNMQVLDNAQCLYYKNPMITDGISPKEAVDWGRYPYYKAVGNHAFYLQNVAKP